jgi:hypothetical protein
MQGWNLSKVLRAALEANGIQRRLTVLASAGSACIACKICSFVVTT